MTNFKTLENMIDDVFNSEEVDLHELEIENSFISKYVIGTIKLPSNFELTKEIKQEIYTLVDNIITLNKLNQFCDIDMSIIKNVIELTVTMDLEPSKLYYKTCASHIKNIVNAIDLKLVEFYNLQKDKSMYTSESLCMNI
jgi:hypothetical protein